MEEDLSHPKSFLEERLMSAAMSQLEFWGVMENSMEGALVPWPIAGLQESWGPVLSWSSLFLLRLPTSWRELFYLHAFSHLVLKCFIWKRDLGTKTFLSIPSLIILQLSQTLSWFWDMVFSEMPVHFISSCFLSLSSSFFLFKNIYLFYLSMRSLSCSM